MIQNASNGNSHPYTLTPCNRNEVEIRRSGRRAPQIICVLLLFAATTTHAEESNAWYIIRFDGKPVGFEQVRVNQSGDDAATLSCFRKTELNLNRMGQHMSVRASLWTTQSVSGILRSFHLQRTDGTGTRVERFGSYSNDEKAFLIREQFAGSRREYTVAVPGDTHSPILAVWLPKLDLPIEKQILLSVFFPETAGASGIAVRKRQTGKERSGQSAVTQRLEFYPDSDPSRISTLFIDGSLQVTRHDKQFMNRTLSMERTSSEVALTAVADKSLDLDAQTIIPIDRLLRNTERAEQVVLEIRVNNGFAPAIPQSTFQQVQRINDTTVRVILSTPALSSPGSQPVLPKTDQPTIASTRWMPLDNPALQRLASMTAGAERNTVSICQRLEAAVHKKMRRSAFSTTLRPADEVARTLKGDCTEHAMLLAALMRIKGIPSRIASGLVHTNQQFGFVGHVWVEALIEGQWVPFDSTFGGTGIKPTRIKLQHSDMPDTLISGVSLFLPILELAGRTTIHVTTQ